MLSVLLVAITGAIAAKKPAPPPAGTSTVLLRLDVDNFVSLRRGSVSNLGFGGLEFYTVGVIDLENKTALRWVLQRVVSGNKAAEKQPTNTPFWLPAYERPGRYLITDFRQTLLNGTLRGNVTEDSSRQIGLEIRVPKPDIAAFYGVISVPERGDPRMESTSIDSSVKEYYEGSVPFKRSELIEGESKILNDWAGIAEDGGPMLLYPQPEFAKHPNFIGFSGPGGIHAGDPVPASVDSLRPTFKWQTSSPDQKVDFAIWESAPRVSPVAGKKKDPRLPEEHYRGEAVYFKAGLTGGEHQPDISLLPGTIYYWSVRASGTAGWATASHSVGMPLVFSKSVRDVFCMFKTPKN